MFITYNLGCFPANYACRYDDTCCGRNCVNYVCKGGASLMESHLMFNSNQQQSFPMASQTVFSQNNVNYYDPNNVNMQNQNPNQSQNLEENSELINKLSNIVNKLKAQNEEMKNEDKNNHKRFMTKKHHFTHDKKITSQHKIKN